MKKILLYTMFSFAMAGLVSCDENFDDWADPQANPQEDSENVTFSAANTSTTVFNLNEISSDSIEVATVAIESPEGTTVSYKIQLSKNEDLTETVSYDLGGDGDVLKMASDDLQAGVVELYNKRPDARQLFIRIDGYISTPGEQTLLVKSSTLEIEVTPVAPVIESAYYITGDVVGAWGPNNLVRFNHSGKDVYEDPIFTLVLENPANEANFKIAPQSALEEGADFWGLVLGTAIDGDDALEGTIVQQDAGAIKIAEAGWVKITLDMMAYTYTIESLDVSPSLLVPGGYQNWSPATAPIVYSQSVNMKYDGYIDIRGRDWDGGFVFLTGPDWPKPENGYKKYATDNTVEDGYLVLEGGENIKVPEGEGFYRLTVDLSELPYTYTATKIEWGLVGDATSADWNAGNAINMALDPDTYQWAAITQLTGGKTIKFVANKSWGTDLGGDLKNLTYGGANITVPTTGEYLVILDLSDPKAYKAILTKRD